MSSHSWTLRAVDPRIRRLVAGLIAVLLLLGLVQVIHHHVLGLVYRIRADWRVLRLWPDGAAQRRARFDPALYEALVAANAALPPDAAILLVTPGVDPFRKEYDAFCRALYHLAPRPIWWVNPAPPVGSWASRWWITVPATAEAIEAIARERGARAALFFQAAVPAELAPVVSLTPDARVVYLDGRPFERSEPMGDPVAAWHPGGLAAGLVVILALGGALVAVAARRGLAVGWIEAAALAWPLGAGATSLAMFWLDALGLPLARQRVAIAALAGVAWLVIWLTRPRSVGLRKAADDEPRVAATDVSTAQPPAGTVAGQPWSRITTGVLCAVIALQTAWVAVLAIGRPLSVYDSWLIWAAKARMIFLDAHIAALFDPSRTLSRPAYPLLVPLVEAWTFAWAGTLDDRLAGVQAVLFFGALLGIGYAALGRLGLAPLSALAVTAALGTLTPLADVASFVYADVPLAVYATLAGAYLVLWLETKSPGALVIAAVGAGLMPWTKREGAILLVALGGALLIVRRREAPRALGAFLLATAVAAGPWWALMARNGIGDAYYAAVTPATFMANIDRVPFIAWMAVTRMLDPAWGHLWALLVLVGIPTIWAARRTVDLLALAAILYLCVVFGSIVFSVFVPFSDHVIFSVDRLPVHVVPLVSLWLACRARESAGSLAARG